MFSVMLPSVPGGQIARLAWFFLQLYLCGNVVFGQSRFVETQTARYQLQKLTSVDGEFAVTDPPVYGLVRNQREFKTFALERPEEIIAQLEVGPTAPWKVVKDQLVIVSFQGWQIRQIPDLKLIKSVRRGQLMEDFVESLVKPKVSTTTPQNLLMGWYDRGLVYDDTGETIVATLRAPGYGRNYDKWRCITIGDQFSVSHFPPQRTSGVSAFPLTSNWPPSLQLTERGIWFPGFDFIFEPIDWSKFDWTARANGNSLSIYPDGSPQKYGGLVLFKENEANFNESTYLGFRQPYFTPPADVNSAIGKARDSTYSISTFPTFGPTGKLQFDKESDEPYPLSHLTGIIAREDFEEAIATYVENVKAEFQFLTGREPVGVPYPVRVSARRGEETFSYFVWLDLDPDEVRATFGSRTFDQEIEDAKAERKREVAAEERKLQAAIKELQIANFADRDRQISENKKVENRMRAGFALILATIGGLVLILLRFTGQSKPAKSRRSRAISGLSLAFLYALTPSPAAAQREITIYKSADLPGEVRLTSVTMPGFPTVVRFNPHSSIALCNCSKEGQFTLVSVNLRRGNIIASAEIPEGWEWTTAEVGRRFAACKSDSKLCLLDMATGKIIETTECYRSEPIRFLFDSYVVIGDTWYQIPNLEKVASPFSDESSNTRFVNDPDTVSSMQLSSTQCFVNGFITDDFLTRPGKFVGHYFQPARIASPPTVTFEAWASARNDDAFEIVADFESIREGLLVRSRTNQNIVKHKGHPRSAQMFEGGFFVVLPEQLLVWRVDERLQRFSALPWIACKNSLEYSELEQGVSVECDLSGADGIGTIKTTGDTFDIFPSGDDELKVVAKPGLADEILSQFEQQCNFAFDGDFNQAVDSYMAHNASWILFAKQVHQYEGVPIELAIPISWLPTIDDSQPTAERLGVVSAVVDVPREALRDLYEQRKLSTDEIIHDDWLDRFQSRPTPEEQVAALLPELTPVEKAKLPGGPDPSMVYASPFNKLELLMTIAALLVVNVGFGYWLVVAGCSYCNHQTHPVKSVELPNAGRLVFGLAGFSLLNQAIGLLVVNLFNLDSFWLASIGLLPAIVLSFIALWLAMKITLRTNFTAAATIAAFVMLSEFGRLAIFLVKKLPTLYS